MKMFLKWSPVFARAAATVGVFSYMVQSSSWEFSFTHYVFVFVALHFLGVAPTPAIFPVMYKLYCSKLIGYNFLRLMMHPRQPKAHSKWMCGVRYLNKPVSSIHGSSPSSSSRAEMCVVEGEVLEVLRQAARDAKKYASQQHVPVVVIPVAVLADNYAYAILSFVNTDVWKLDTANITTPLAEVSIQCALVDPADPIFIMEAVSKLVGRAFLQASPPSKNDTDAKRPTTDEEDAAVVPTVTSVVVTHALTTHKHWDHAGGNLELVQFSQQGTLSVKLQDGTDHVVQVRPSVGSHTELAPMSPTSPVRISSTLRMIGSAVDLPDGTNVTVHGGDRVQLVLPPECGSTLDGDIVLGAPYVEVIESPGHTEGSVVFLVVAPSLTTTTSSEASADRKEDDVTGKAQLGRSALFTGDCVFCGGCGAMFEVKKAEPVLQTYDAFHGDEFLVVPKPVQYKHQPHKSDEKGTTTTSNYFSEGIVISNTTEKSLYKGTVPTKLEPTEVLLYVGHEYTQRLFVDLAERSSKWVHSAPHYALAVSRRHDELKRLWSMVGDNACTVPSTLLCERRTNPLLSIERAVLLDLQKRSANSGDIERSVYLSENRRID